MADHFVKLWASVTDSSIWSLSSDERIVWVTMLVMADEHGFVGASVDGLARRANVSIEATKMALEAFMSPDPYSRNADNEGRRIEVVPRGWHIFNHNHFRDLRDKEARRLYERERKAAQRMKSRTVPDSSRTIPKSPAMSAQEEASEYAEAQPDIQSTSPPKRAAKARPSPSDDPQFLAFWDAYGKKKSIGQAWKAWQKLPAGVDRDAVIAAAKAASDHYVASKDGRQYQPYPATWLSAMGWEDDLSTAKPKPRGVQVGDPEEDW